MKILCAALLAYLPLEFAHSAGAVPPSLTMEVKPVVNAGTITLTFKLTYQGNDEIVVDRSVLPGVQRMQAVYIDAGRFPDRDLPRGTHCGNLEEVIVIDDPGPGTQLVTPGEEFIDVIRLNDWYRGWEGVLGRCEVVINWSYKLYTHSGVIFPRMAGSIVVPSNQVPLIPPRALVFGVEVSKSPRTEGAK